MPPCRSLQTPASRGTMGNFWATKQWNPGWRESGTWGTSERREVGEQWAAGGGAGHLKSVGLDVGRLGSECRATFAARGRQDTVRGWAKFGQAGELGKVASTSRSACREFPRLVAFISVIIVDSNAPPTTAIAMPDIERSSHDWVEEQRNLSRPTTRHRQSSSAGRRAYRDGIWPDSRS